MPPKGVKRYDRIGPNKTAIEVKKILSLAPYKYFSNVLKDVKFGLSLWKNRLKSAMDYATTLQIV